MMRSLLKTGSPSSTEEYSEKQDETEVPTVHVPIPRKRDGAAQERDPTIDNLRFISLLTVMYSHVSGVLFSELNMTFLRFNVMFMVLPSALGARLSTRQRNYFEYMWEKVKSIIFSAYIFAFLLWYTNKNFQFPVYFDLRNYLNLNTYGNLGCFYWFICGYMAIYAVTPPIRWLNQRVTSNTVYYVGVFAVGVLFESLHRDYFPYYPRFWEYHYFYGINSVFFPVAYAAFFRMPELPMNQFYFLLAWTAAYHFGLQYYHYTHNMSTALVTYNWPMTTTYSSYGMMCSMIFYRFSHLLNALIQFLGLRDTAAFISKHSLWVYFWHFPFCNSCSNYLPLGIKAYLLFLFGFAFTKTQVSLVERLAARCPPVIAYNLKLMLT